MERIAKTGAESATVANIDTTTPAGRMMMQMVASFAEFERAMIRERTSAGLAAARPEGRISGRRKKETGSTQRAPSRRKRYLRPQVRRGYGASLWCQPANGIPNCRQAPS